VTHQEHALVQFQPMVKRIAHHVFRKVPSNVEFDDLFQAGMIGLHDALTRFMPEEGVKPETFLSKRVRGAMIDELRRQDWLTRSERHEIGDSFFMTSLDIEDDDGNKTTSYEVEADENTEKYFTMKQMVKALSAEIERLPESEQRVLSMMYEHDLSQSEVAHTMNVSSSRVCQIHKKAVDRLALRMRKAGF
jgi:RNA polymerase sigma factor FliA